MTKNEGLILLGIGTLCGILILKTRQAPVTTTIATNSPWHMYNDPEIWEWRHSTDAEGGTLFYEQRPVTHIPDDIPPSKKFFVSRNGGVPRTNAERAMNHYGITYEQYIACPGCYPLPERGTGLNRRGG